LTTASNCTFVGATCGDAITTGANVTAIGSNAAGSLTTGGDMVAIGRNAASSATTQNQITCIGFLAGTAITADGCVLIGANCATSVTNASETVIVGRAVQNIASGANLTNIQQSVVIGTLARPNANSQTNQILIGYDSRGDGTNTSVVGNTNTTQSRLYGATFLSTGANGQSTQLGQSTTLLSGLTGATVTATNLIPANSILLGVTARVTTAITGATTFDIGDGTTANRFGDDVAIALNTTSNQVIAPAAFTAANNVVLTANGSNFTGGAVRLTAHFMTLVAPTS
jgi:hypothetical protein